MARFFINPNLLWALTVLPVLAGLAFRSRWRRRTFIDRLGTPSVIAGQVERGAGRWRLMVGWSLGLIALVVGAAGPRWGQGPPPPTAPGRDIVVVLDLSRSMLAQDVLPSRLGKAKEALREFADAVQASGGHRLALVAFAGQATVICPLTHDYDHFRAKLAALSADPPPAAVRATGPDAVSGTRIGAGLLRAAGLLSAEPQFRGAQDILLVSDGDDPAGDEEWRTGLAVARVADVPVDVVGVGDPNADSAIPTAAGHLTFQGVEARTRLQELPLREIANHTGGLCLAARTGPLALDEYFRDRIASAPTREAVAGTLPQPVGRQAWFFGLALTLLIVTFVPLSPWAAARGFLRTMIGGLSRMRRPAATLVALVLVSATPPSYWLRRGNDELAAGRPEAALAEFGQAAHWTTDPGGVAFDEGVALYRLGRFRGADLHFRRCLSDAVGSRHVQALYNLGCSLLEESQGRLAGPLRGAVSSFEASFVGMRPNDPLADDVRHNLELAKRLLAVVRAATPNQPEEPPDGPPPGQSPSRGPEESNPAIGREPGGTQVSPDDRPLPKGKAGDATSPQTTDKRPPGKGHLPPLPDEDALTPLTPEDAQAHLQKATERIAAERRAQLQRTTPAAATRFPEW